MKRLKWLGLGGGYVALAVYIARLHAEGDWLLSPKILVAFLILALVLLCWPIIDKR